MTMLDASLAYLCKLTPIRYPRRLRSITAADNSTLTSRIPGVVVERPYTHNSHLHRLFLTRWRPGSLARASSPLFAVAPAAANCQMESAFCAPFHVAAMRFRRSAPAAAWHPVTVASLLWVEPFSHRCDASCSAHRESCAGPSPTGGTILQAEILSSAITARTC